MADASAVLCFRYSTNVPVWGCADGTLGHTLERAAGVACQLASPEAMLLRGVGVACAFLANVMSGGGSGSAQ